MLRKAALAFALLGLAIGAEPRAQQGKRPMSEIFQLIEGAADARAAGPRRVGEMLGLAFRGPAEGSNDVFEILTSQRSRTVDELIGGELRVHRATRTSRLLILQVDPRVRCVSNREVIDRYGQPREVSIPHPPQPADGPTYFKYPAPWGELRIGIAGDRPSCVVSVVAEFMP